MFCARIMPSLCCFSEGEGSRSIEQNLERVPARSIQNRCGRKWSDGSSSGIFFHRYWTKRLLTVPGFEQIYWFFFANPVFILHQELDIAFLFAIIMLSLICFSEGEGCRSMEQYRDLSRFNDFFLRIPHLFCIRGLTLRCCCCARIVSSLSCFGEREGSRSMEQYRERNWKRSILPGNLF
jgi:hypothetical protein